MFCNKCGTQLNDNTIFCPNCGNNLGNNVAAAGFAPVAPMMAGAPVKSKTTALLLCLFLGNLGVHRFYVGKTGSAVGMLLTGGCCGIWTLIDFIMILCDNFTDSRGVPIGMAVAPALPSVPVAPTVPVQSSVSVAPTVPVQSSVPVAPPAQNGAGGMGFAVTALILGGLGVLSRIYWPFIRPDFIKDIIEPMWMTSREEASALMNLVDALNSFPFGMLALLFAILTLLKGGKGARIMAIIAVLIAYVGSWLFYVISYLCLYLAA